jgi:hypothetical protein
MVQALLAVALAIGGGCSEERRYTLVVQVTTDDGKPLAGVPVKLGDGTRGTTDDLGQLRRRVAGEEGSRFAVSVEAPAGYAVAGGARSGGVVLRHLVDADNGAKSLPVEYRVKLAPTTRTYAVLVRAGVPNLPVLAFGAEKATTNRSGVAMFLYQGTPGEQLTVKIDTSSAPRLQPQNPTTTFQLGNKMQAFVIKERFTAAPERRGPRVRRVGPKRL